MNLLDIFSGGASSIGEGIAGVFSKLIEEFHIPPDKALAAQQEATDAANKFIMDKAALAQQGINAEMASKQAELDSVTKDRDSARQMSSQIQSASTSSWLARNVAFCIDIFVTFIWGSMTVFLIARTLHLIISSPSVDMTAVMGIYAAITSSFTLILMFHRGSTVSSKGKDDTINTMAKNATP